MKSKIGIAIATALCSALAFALVASAQDGDGGNSDGGDDSAQERPEGKGFGHGPFGGEVPEELEAFKDCMADQGIERPERGELEDGEKPERPDPEEIDAAYEECKSELTSEQQERFNERRAAMEERKEAMDAFRTCMEGEGIELPDRESGERPDPAEKTDAEREAFMEAAGACKDKLPEGGIGRGGPGGHSHPHGHGHHGGPGFGGPGGPGAEGESQEDGASAVAPEGELQAS